MSNALINMHGLGRGEVLIDGRELTGVRGFTLTGEVGQPTRLELDVLVLERASMTGEVEVVIPEGVRDTLTALGWTPPPNPQ